MTTTAATPENVRINVSPSCVSSLIGLPGFWAFKIKGLTRPAIAIADDEDTAKALIKEAIADEYIGDWEFTARDAEKSWTRITAPQGEIPCAWCKRHGTYSH